jgi:DNA-directed RNA polymerase specialized sigma24 family protein
VTVLDADEHFDALRGPVRARFRGPAELFEDAYAEFWCREAERSAAGRASDAAAPVAFIAEAIQRILIDQARSRGRGLARDAKHTLQTCDLDDQHHLRAAADTVEDAEFSALVHRILDLVEGCLSAREMRVFQACFLYLLSTPRAAAVLGLSEPRVKKDRLRILEKVGSTVWPVLAGDLGCSASRNADPSAGFELMATHVEECERCSGLRAGALAVVGPLELLALAQPGILDHVVARCFGTAQRVGDFVTAVPPAGRGAAAAGLAAAVLAGGAAASLEPRPVPEPVRAAAPVPKTVAARPVPVVRSVRAVRTVVPRKRVRKVVRARPQPRATAAAIPLRAPPAAVVTAAPTPPPKPDTGEFGFEQD